MDYTTMDEQIDNILAIDSYFDKEEAKGNIVRKDSAKSEEVRKACNRIFVSKHSRGKEDHRMILALYSKSIALALKDSEQLALAYSNRSALLKHLNFPEKCLIDIDRALKITKSDNLKIKLLARKTECLKLKDEQDKSDKNLSLNDNNIENDKQFQLVPTTEKFKFPTFIPSQEIPCAAESITIACSESSGRHIIATRDIKPGEVLIVEEGYVIFPKISTMYMICSNCLTFAWNGVPCDHCALAMYCSEECKNKAWEEYHDIECSILPFLHSKLFKQSDLPAIAMTARFFIRAVKSEGLENVLMESHNIDEKHDMHLQDLLSNGVYDNKKFKFCYNLLTHEENTKKRLPKQEFYESMLVNLLLKHSSLLNKYKIINNDNLTLTNPMEILKIKNILTKITNIIAVNFHSFQGSLCDCIVEGLCDEMCIGKRGSIFASCSSLLNHSCHPNVSRMFMPERKIVIFTTCLVKKGEQLCDTYGTTVRYDGTWERQLYLRMYFGFKCNCQACSEDWTTELSRTVLMDFKKLNPKWYINRYLKADAVDQWPYDEETMKDVVEASQLAYNTFDQNEAYLLSIPCREYIDNAFFKFYGDKCHIPDKC